MVYDCRPLDQMNGPYDDVIDVTLRRSDMGFGFRVVGGKEEQTQVRKTFL